MLFFDKLTCEHNNKKKLKFFILLEYIFKVGSNAQKQIVWCFIKP